MSDRNDDELSAPSHKKLSGQKPRKIGKNGLKVSFAASGGAEAVFVLEGRC